MTHLPLTLLPLLFAAAAALLPTCLPPTPGVPSATPTAGPQSPLSVVPPVVHSRSLALSPVTPPIPEQNIGVGQWHHNCNCNCRRASWRAAAGEPSAPAASCTEELFGAEPSCGLGPCGRAPLPLPRSSTDRSMPSPSLTIDCLGLLHSQPRTAPFPSAASASPCRSDRHSVSRRGSTARSLAAAAVTRAQMAKRLSG